MVANLICSGVSKPFDIMRILHKKNIINVSIRQLRSLIIKIKDTNKIGSLNYGDLVEQIEKMSAIPEDFDEAFICSSEFHSNKEFRFFITTKKLLLETVNKKIIHADATYKITYHGYPMHVFGENFMNGFLNVLCIVYVLLSLKISIF